MATKKATTKTATTKYAKVNDAAKDVADTAQSIIIEQPTRALLGLEIGFETPVIQNCFAQKTLEDMLRKHMGLTVVREKKVPRECIERAKVKNTEGVICVPSTAFKKGMITARTLVKGISKTQLQTQIFVKGNAIPLNYEEQVHRMDLVRTAGINRQPDIRFRPEYRGCSARLVIEYPPGDFKVQSIVDLLNRAGSVGVGEWRPEKNGIYGRYYVKRHIDTQAEINEVLTECSPLVQPLIIPEWAMDAEVDEKLLRKVAYGEKDEEQPDSPVETRELNEDELDEEVAV